MRALGLTKAYFSSAYSRRNVRGTNHPSKHSYGLAIDIHTFSGPELGTLRVDRDFEQGLGDEVDCVGAPLTQGGAVLKILQCQLVRSGLFHLVLSPDYDDAHHDHFHLRGEAVERASVAPLATTRDPLILSATNSTASDHASQTIAQNHTAHAAVTPNVFCAIAVRVRRPGRTRR